MEDSTPICRCRVLYLGSAVPRQSKDGLQGVQEPLRSLYPLEGAIGAKGIDSWLSVWSNGILLENMDENLKQITRFFPIESLHYCAAVRQVLIPERDKNPEPKFLPLDSPFARMPRALHPPIFAAILRRTTGIKVLECHVFICKREAAANALVRCCFHAYADNSYVRQLETSKDNEFAESTYGGTLESSRVGKSKAAYTNVELNQGLPNNNNNNNNNNINISQGFNNGQETQSINGSRMHDKNASSMRNTPESVNLITSSTNETGVHEGYQSVNNFVGSKSDLNVISDDVDSPLYDNDENHKVWIGSQDNIALENPYAIYSGVPSTIGRRMRARQIKVPIYVPPPPLIVKEEYSRNKSKKSSSNGSGSQSLSGTLVRPKPNKMPILQKQQGPNNVGKSPLMYGGGLQGSHYPRPYHTISYHNTPPRPMQVMHNPYISTPRHMPLPLPVMLPQQYATIQSTPYKKRDAKKNGVPVNVPIISTMFAYHPPAIPPPLHNVMGHPNAAASRTVSMMNKKLSSSLGNGLDDVGNSEAESQGGTGIYKRKGHLNERAFSYSIRQEHRSRSHGSLASLQFNPLDMKKEREIAQMVNGLNLNDDVGVGVGVGVGAGVGDLRSSSQPATQRKYSGLSNTASDGPHGVYGNAAFATYGNAMNRSSSTFRKLKR